MSEVTKRFNPSVSSHGYSDANIFFLSGFPLKEDLAQGMALSGSQRQTLNNFLRPYSIDVKQTYSSLFIKEQLSYSGQQTKKLKLAISEVDTNKYLDVLFEEIKDVNPNVIVPLDDIALGAVINSERIQKKPRGRKYFLDCYRGSVLPLRDDFQVKLKDYVRLIPTFGPQLLNTDYSARAYVQIDYKRIAENKLKREPIKEVGIIWSAKSASEVHQFFLRGLDNHIGFVTFDIETFGGLITCISFCFDGNESCSIPLSPYYYPEINKGEMALIWHLVAKLLAHKIPKCNQNIKYDWSILERHGFFVNNVIHDTMLKASLIYPEFAKGLDFLTSIYTPIPYYKDEGKEYNPKEHEKTRLLFYNAKDSISASLINVEQDKELEEAGLKDLYYNEIAPLIRIYKNIDGTGLLVDDHQRQRLIFKYSRMYEMNRDILRGMIGNYNFNPGSWQQVGKLIYEELKFPPKTKTNEVGEKVWKTDKETLDELLINHGEENKYGRLGYIIISRLTLCKKLAKVLEFLDTPLTPNGRLCGVSNLAGTETGRSSSSKTIDELLLNEEDWDGVKRKERVGRSLQTISKHGFTLDEEVFDSFEDNEIAHDLRSMFVPDPGFCFIEGDGNGAEARVVFVLAEDYEGLADMDRKPKIHAKTAAFVFEIPLESIKKDLNGNWTPSIPRVGITYYDAGKRVSHAGNYDMTAFRLSQMSHLPIGESNRRLERFHQLRPNIRGVFHAEVNKALQNKRELVTPFGRKRKFFGRMDNSMFKQGKAQVPQSAISDLTKFTFRRIIDALPGYMTAYKFVTEQHDGILSMVRNELKEQYLETFKKCYERPIDFRVGSLQRDFELTIPAELSVSETNWMNLREIQL